MCLMTETDSPVRIDWSMRIVVDMTFMMRMSAGILSPTEANRNNVGPPMNPLSSRISLAA